MLEGLDVILYSSNGILSSVLSIFLNSVLIFAILKHESTKKEQFEVFRYMLISITTSNIALSVVHLFLIPCYMRISGIMYMVMFSPIEIISNNMNIFLYILFSIVQVQNVVIPIIISIDRALTVRFIKRKFPNFSSLKVLAHLLSLSIGLLTTVLLISIPDKFLPDRRRDYLISRFFGTYYDYLRIPEYFVWHQYINVVVQLLTAYFHYITYERVTTHEEEVRISMPQEYSNIRDALLCICILSALVHSFTSVFLIFCFHSNFDTGNRSFPFFIFPMYLPVFYPIVIFSNCGIFRRQALRNFTRLAVSIGLARYIEPNPLNTLTSETQTSQP